MKGFLVSQVAKAVELHPDTVRRLERKGIISSKRDVNGWRRYSPEAVETIRRLYELSDTDAILKGR